MLYELRYITREAILFFLCSFFLFKSPTRYAMCIHHIHRCSFIGQAYLGVYCVYNCLVATSIISLLNKGSVNLTGNQYNIISCFQLSLFFGNSPNNNGTRREKSVNHFCLYSLSFSHALYISRRYTGGPKRHQHSVVRQFLFSVSKDSLFRCARLLGDGSHILQLREALLCALSFMLLSIICPPLSWSRQGASLNESVVGESSILFFISFSKKKNQEVENSKV